MTELTDEQFGGLFDSLGDQSDSHVIAWEELDADARRQIRALYDRARNIGFDEGHKEGEQDGYKSATGAIREDITKLADHFTKSCSAPFVSAADVRVLSHVAEKLRELIK